MVYTFFGKRYRHRGYSFLNSKPKSLSFSYSLVYGTFRGRVNPALAIPFLALSIFYPSYTVSSPGGYDVPWPSQSISDYPVDNLFHLVKIKKK